MGKRAICIVLVMFLAVLSVPMNVSAAQMNWVDLDRTWEAGFELNTETLFWDGLAVVYDDQQSQYNYLDENYRLVDLNKGRFKNVFPFFEGLAAVLDKNNKLGYINKYGEIVIECRFGVADVPGSEIYTGFFRDGVATVFKEYYEDVREWDRIEDKEIMVAQIDKTGAIVKEYWDCREDFKGLHLISQNDFFDGEEMTELQAKQSQDPTTTASEWARIEILNASDHGLLTPSTQTDMQTDISRFQFTELVVNMVEKATGKSIIPAADNTFTDCMDTAVLKAFACGIVNGTSSTTFSPDSLITREQIATMLYRAATYIEKETNETYMQKNENLNAYTDKDNVSSWAKSAVGIMANNGIMNGTSETTLSPKNNASIEQCVILVFRLHELIVPRFN